jgi:hypothetical protein
MPLHVLEVSVHASFPNIGKTELQGRKIKTRAQIGVAIWQARVTTIR